MFSQNPYLFEKNVQMKQEELARETAQIRLVRQYTQEVKAVRPVRLKYRLFAIIGLVSALLWFFR